MLFGWHVESRTVVLTELLKAKLWHPIKIFFKYFLNLKTSSAFVLLNFYNPHFNIYKKVYICCSIETYMSAKKNPLR